MEGGGFEGVLLPSIDTGNTRPIVNAYIKL